MHGLHIIKGALGFPSPQVSMIAFSPKDFAAAGFPETFCCCLMGLDTFFGHI